MIFLKNIRKQLKEAYLGLKVNDHSRYKNLVLSSKQSQCMKVRLKVILLLQVSSHDFEPTFITFCLNWRILPDQPKLKKNHQTFDTQQAS